MQIGFTSYLVLFCSLNCFPLFVVRPHCYGRYQTQGKDLKAFRLYEHPPVEFATTQEGFGTSQRRDRASQGTKGQALLPPARTGSNSHWQCGFAGSCCWPSRSTETEFPREILCLTTFFCVGITYSTSPSDAYHIFEQSFEVAVFCFAPVIKMQH